MTIGINWDEEDARYNPAVLEKSIAKEIAVDSANVGASAPSVLSNQTASPVVKQAIAPPAVATTSNAGSPAPFPTAQTPTTPDWVNNAANAGGSGLKSMWPIIDPRHYDQNGQLDQATTAAHAAADAAAGYTTIKTVQGVGSGISRRISNVIGGVDPTIQAQINQSNKQAARAASSPQGRMPDPIATPQGRIEPTMFPDPISPSPSPTPPTAPATPVEKAALAVGEQTPLQQAQLRHANAKADLAELDLLNKQQASLAKTLPSSNSTALLNTPEITPLSIEPAAVTADSTKAVTKTPEITGQINAPIAANPSVASTLPVTETPASVVKTTPAKEPITGKTGSAVSPKQRAEKTQLTYKDTPETWQKLTKEGTTFLPGYGTGDNHLFNAYGADGRKAVLDQFNNGKPIGSYENFQKLNKEVISKGVKIGDVPTLMEKLPAYSEGGNYGQLGKALKVGGAIGLGLTAAQLANAAEEAKKGNYSKAGGQVAEAGSSFLPPWLQGLMFSKGANANEAEDLAFQRRMAEASKKGAGNRGLAYDSRKIYTPMDISNPMFNIGVPPPH